MKRGEVPFAANATPGAWPAVRRIAPVLLAVFAGCSGPLKLDRPPELPAQYQSNEADTANAQSFDETQLANWWLQYDDPALDTLIQRALAHNYDLALAATRVDDAHSNILAARSALLPTIGVGVEAAKFHGGETQLEFAKFLGITDLDAQFWRVGLQTQWEIDVFGRGRARLAAARAMTLAAAGDAQAARLAVVATVADAYMTYRGLIEQRRLIVQSREIAADFVVIAQHSFLAGVVLSTDIDAARAALAQVQAREQEVNSAIVAARLAIEQICAARPGELADVLDETTGLPHALPAIAPGQPVDLLERRPDLIAARDRLFASLRQADVARLNYWPTFSLSAVLARNGWEIAGQSLGTSTLWLFGAAAVMPLIDFGARESRVQATDAQARAAEIAYEKAASGALFDVEQALTRLSRQTQLQAARNDEVAQRRTLLGKVQTQLRVGEVGRMDVDRAQLALADSEAALVRERVGELSAQIALFRAMGGGWEKTGTPLELSPSLSAFW
ncbi:efflux transporter outer membrane subunit [Paraburkholderia silvatlantica]|uniref:NodT family efflux transporter outer membrane factor (OMF) lipoprotein n=1 Tax=Paraburkholderia silvatlantica TaxID=321895 RepID=A0ABR6FGB3_9BURK|nr:efflux transporter outer membrane subunit [Paraburkholderia silvatlantica]MBB2925860.1 NodT family efflux transporter outer membrane factor (OMF) lipoprotein [Paraburkholderia silvatlantica]PVY33399.1 NodT family efflux transporter outer membrane factor (OMF) lipoprotein [Paraburkholderia silvatlantica]PXW38339.1 NodT family efflux transporter outer membrane factor (OMF) lipoprotein [Paraburkholderia silvatlantica]TDQ92791.1 NodT family efflux transporter outer membrane factor (OMF) lipoprot